MSEPDVAAWTRQQVEANLDDAKRDLDRARRPGYYGGQDSLCEEGEAMDRVARCEAELGILDEHYILRGGDTNPAYEQYSVIEPPFPSRGCGCVTCHYGAQGGVHGYGICRTVRLLASGYRHRPGYQEAWRP